MSGLTQCTGAGIGLPDRLRVVGNSGNSSSTETVVTVHTVSDGFTLFPTIRKVYLHLLVLSEKKNPEKVSAGTLAPRRPPPHRGSPEAYHVLGVAQPYPGHSPETV